MPAHWTVKRLSFYEFLLLLITAMAAESLSAETIGGYPCHMAETLPLNETLRERQAPSTAPDVFQVMVAEGILALAVSPLPIGSTQPELILLEGSCAVEETPAARLELIQETPRWLVLRVHEAGRLHLAVASEDPGTPLNGYKLRTDFVGQPQVSDERLLISKNPPASCESAEVPPIFSEPVEGNGYLILERALDPTEDVEPLDCDILELTVANPTLFVVDNGTGRPLRAALHRGIDCRPRTRRAEATLGEKATGLGGLVYPGRYRLALEPRDSLPVSYELLIRHYDMCAQGEQDDHGDTPFCATALNFGTLIGGEISNIAGDDEDYFTFFLTSQQTIKIETEGPIEGVLYDDGGQQLVSSDKCRWARDSFTGPGEIVRTLGPGRYHLRLRGLLGATGPYALRLLDVARP